jgi:KipI family sensor histidine kinase inhibitor
MRVRRVGASALLLECRDGDDVEAWRGELWRRRAAGEFTAADIVPGEASVLLDGVHPTLAARIASWPVVARSDRMTDRPLVEIPAIFDGEDFGDVADTWGVSLPVAVQRLVTAELTVAFCGFAPGFAYLRGLPAEWAVSRLDAPRQRVPAGSIALAGSYAGIYPSASPGGWRLVGRTSAELFDVRREPPALLTPGTRVRLVPQEAPA